MARSEVQFHMRIIMPGSAREKGGKDGVIGYDEMMNTIDRAYERGRLHGWQEAMGAVREAATRPATARIAAAVDFGVEKAIQDAKPKTPLDFSA